MPQGPSEGEIEVGLRGVRAVVGIVAGSMSAALEQVTPAQLRTLVLLRSSGPLQVGRLADLLRLTPSGATRAAARMDRAGWVERRRSGQDRRAVTLHLTAKGASLVDGVIRARRRELEEAFARMDAEQRRAAVHGLAVLADAVGEPADDATLLLLALRDEP